jgi:Na+-transporting NADH:ubiquinone oxidoreductase subunit NqrA
VGASLLSVLKETQQCVSFLFLKKQANKYSIGRTRSPTLIGVRNKVHHVHHKLVLRTLERVLLLAGRLRVP